MTLPALVLVHGAQHAADCWDLTIDEIHRQAPELTVLAVDLPGRRGKPGDLITATIDDWVDSVVSDIEKAAVDGLILVGHSMAGLTVPGVVTKFGSGRVREMIFAAAFVPPDGTALVDTGFILSRPPSFWRTSTAPGCPTTFRAPGFSPCATVLSRRNLSAAASPRSVA